MTHMNPLVTIRFDIRLPVC